MEYYGRRKRLTGDGQVIEAQHTYLFDQEFDPLITGTAKVQISGKQTVDVDNQSFNGTFTHTLKEEPTRQT